MTDENELGQSQSRRKFLKTTGAVGAVATTGVAAFGGQAAAQGQSQGDVIQDLTAEQVSQATQRGLANVFVSAQIVDAVDVQNVQIRIARVLEDVDVEVLEGGITIEDVNVNANVVVQALNAGGQVIDTATTQID